MRSVYRESSRRSHTHRRSGFRTRRSSSPYEAGASHDVFGNRYRLFCALSERVGSGFMTDLISRDMTLAQRRRNPLWNRPHRQVR